MTSSGEALLIVGALVLGFALLAPALDRATTGRRKPTEALINDALADMQRVGHLLESSDQDAQSRGMPYRHDTRNCWCVDPRTGIFYPNAKRPAD